MSDIIIKKKNESTLYVETTHRIYGELSNYFSAFVDNYKWMPKFKSGSWDGKLRVFDTRNYTLPMGLLYKLHEFCQKGRYTYTQNFQIGEELDKNEFEKFIMSLEIPFEIRDYQFQAAYDAITKWHLNISSSTSSGKSLIMYIIVRWMIQKNMKVLICVPSTQLVEQCFSDFYSYGWTNVEDKVCMIYAGKERLVHRPVQISTWQSIYTEKDIDLIQSYDTVLIDECLHPDSLVSMKDGTKKRIEDIVVGEEVVTKNEDTGDIEFNKVNKVYKNLHISMGEKMYKVYTEDGNCLFVTGNHKVKTLDGWKRIDQLSITDVLEKI